MALVKMVGLILYNKHQESKRRFVQKPQRDMRCMTFADCRLQTTDRRPQTADYRPPTADCMRQQDCKLNETKNIVIKVASSSTLPCSEK